MPQANVLKGLSIARDIPYREPDALFALAGSDGLGKSAYLPIGAGLLDRHMLLLGGAGTGKTNMLLHLARNLRANLTPEDTLFIFDSTGEFYNALYQKGDAVLADDKRGTDDAWNLFQDLPNDNRLIEDASSLCDALFHTRIANAARPFFPTAARDLLLALIVYLKRRGEAALMNNKALRELIDGFDEDSMTEIVASIPECRAFASYLAQSGEGSAHAVAAELQSAARELFGGRFGDEGSLGIRSLVREGGKIVFVCYDSAHGTLTAPVFAALVDMCMAEVLSRVERGGNVYLLMDGIGALPVMPHLENALLLGRSRGLRLIMAATGVEAFDRYGVAARSMLTAIGATVAFRLAGRASRDYVKGLYGRHRAVESYRSNVQHGMVEQVVDAYVISDEDLTSLQTGESILSTMHYPPFLFRLRPYGAENPNRI